MFLDWEPSIEVANMRISHLTRILSLAEVLITVPCNEESVTQIQSELDKVITEYYGWEDAFSGSFRRRDS